jgi:hypothetical protein
MKKYLVKRGIEKGDKRYEAGQEVEASKLRGWPVKAWLKSGVLEVVENGDG